MEFMGREVPADGTDLTLGILVFLMSLALIFHHVPTFWRTWWTKNEGELEPYPYMALLVNFTLLMFYSLPLKTTHTPFKHYCLRCSCDIGLLIEGCSVVGLRYCSTKIKWHEEFARGIITVGFLCLAFFIREWFEFLFSEGRNKLLGPMVVAAGIMMYTSPLFPIVRMYKTKRVDHLPFSLCTTLGLYGLTWTVYACLPSTFDLFFRIVHGIGTILSVVLLGVSYALLLKFRTLPASDLDDADLERSCGSGDGAGVGIGQPLLN